MCPSYKEKGTIIEGDKIIVLARKIVQSKKQLMLTSNHKGNKATAEGDATAFIDREVRALRQKRN